MESSMLEYAVERDCELMQIGGLLDQKGYGIGLPKGSPYREEISRAILQLQEKTVLTELKEKWWKDKSVVCPAVVKKGTDDGGSIGGIFIILPPPRGIWYQLRHSLCVIRSSDHVLKRKIDNLIVYEQGRPTYQYKNDYTEASDKSEGQDESHEEHAKEGGNSKKVKDQGKVESGNDFVPAPKEEVYVLDVSALEYDPPLSESCSDTPPPLSDL
ncbi:hypothetical protein OESDEN_02287 [Oesophagostomum dentatum]|uniref:Ionotropic glutamate receptor C-terminal domain-containing protein n=1 Tax=Oesophagostomum dentatum TaxID=61180 RepID=A0A0B1TPJ4_OESDE|nr:hypothetical protein OESDEN_02287 [Oesophagostomum dentatum]